MSERAEEHSRQGLKRCAEWLTFCLEIGWSKDTLDALEELFWRYHDRNGNLKQEPTHA